MPVTWIASRFNAATEGAHGALLMFNSYMGAFARVPAADTAAVRDALQNGITGAPKGILAELSLNGFFVPAHVDELARIDRLLRDEHEVAARRLQLILMPNEQCNFRCKYCAQTFVRKKMGRSVIEGIVAHVAERAAELEHLTIGWFGGEPLTAPRVIDEVAGRLQSICEARSISYSSSMTTNGYLLTPSVADMLLRRGVRGFQITLDGLPEHHDRLRVLGDGTTGTFHRILSNLRLLRRRDDWFRVVLRVNFDQKSSRDLGAFNALMEDEFARDERFCIDFHPIGRWGGPNDADLAVCGLDDGRADSIAHAKDAIARGIDPFGLTDKLRRGGSKCYAARPYSFVIGSDGTVYKCTVAFDDPRNQVGVIRADGVLTLDDEKHAQWIGSGADRDQGCRSCFFSPSCQGNACPLGRMNSGRRPCPTAKVKIHDVMHALSEAAGTTRCSGCSGAPPYA